MSDANSVLKGNFQTVKAVAAPEAPRAQDGASNEFERRAREQVGGSIAFVTRVADEKKDSLFWEGD